MPNYKSMMETWKNWRLDEATLENETNLPFKVMGIRNNDIIIEGKKIKLTLSFSALDLYSFAFFTVSSENASTLDFAGAFDFCIREDKSLVSFVVFTVFVVVLRLSLIL